MSEPCLLLPLQEVPYQEADPDELYTISAKGVTVVRSGAGAELTDPARWKREAAMFQQLKQRPMFRTFSSWKPFRCPALYTADVLTRHCPLCPQQPMHHRT